MKTIVNKLQNGDSPTQTKVFLVMLVVFSIGLAILTNAGVIHFDKY